MKLTLRFGIVLVAVLVQLQITGAQTAKFRHLMSIYADDKGEGLNAPEGIGCGANGQVVVADTGNDRLVRFAYSDKTVTAQPVVKIPEVAAPRRIRLDSKGNVYVLDGKARRIVRLAADGTFQNHVAFDGAPPPSTIVAKDFTIDASDNLLVLDVFSSRVLVADRSGKFQRALPFPDGMGFGSDLAIDETGIVFLFDSTKRRLYSADKDAKAFVAVGGHLMDAVTTMPTFMTASKGTIFVVEGPAGRIVSLRRDGTFISRALSAGQEDGALSQPSQFCINDKDEVFVADRGNSRVQVFQLIR